MSKLDNRLQELQEMQMYLRVRMHNAIDDEERERLQDELYGVESTLGKLLWVASLRSKEQGDDEEGVTK